MSNHLTFARGCSTAALLTAALAASPAPALAQTVELDTLYVEGATLGGEGVPEMSVGSAVTVVTGEQLR
ncbi:MAG: hypothetical protein AB7O70_02760 [Hyphomicrobiales bacterium]